MAMDFWEAQHRARKQTAFYLAFFVVLTLVTALFVEMGTRHFAPDQYNPSWPICGLVFLTQTFLVSFFHYESLRSLGGRHVAESMGARLVEVGSNLKEAQLLNIIEECTVASSLPAPKVYIIDAQQINAFAAGLSPEDAAIAVTTGALDQLSREELQGVIAHEFSHIGNGDMKIGLRLAAMLAGFYWLLYVASRILDLFEGSRNRNSSSSGRGGSSSSSSGGAGGAGGVGLFFVVVLMFFAAGIIGWILGSILKSAISCQREYLADASSAQYTRNPSGLANALRKILHETVKDMPKKGMFYSHLYLEDHSSFSLFETHPPLRERIRALEGIPTEAAL